MLCEELVSTLTDTPGIPTDHRHTQTHNLPHPNHHNPHTSLGPFSSPQQNLKLLAGRYAPLLLLLVHGASGQHQQPLQALQGGR